MKRTPFLGSSCFLFVLTGTLVAGFGQAVYGQMITLYTPYQDVIRNTVDVYSNTGQGVTNTTSVTSLPFSAATTATDGSASSVVSGDLSTSASTTSLNYMVSESIPNNNSFGSAEFTLYFTALVNATYVLSGSALATGTGPTAANMYVLLVDLSGVSSSSDYDHAYYQSSAMGNTSVTLDSIGGPLTGTLVAGHLYKFNGNYWTGDPGAESLGAFTGLTITATPEPSTWAMMTVGAVMLVAFKAVSRSRNFSR